MISKLFHTPQLLSNDPLITFVFEWFVSKNVLLKVVVLDQLNMQFAQSLYNNTAG